MNFEKLNLIKPLMDAVSACGYDEPTPIQRETIPAVLDGRDVLGCAQTGTGKTAAFALPILQRLTIDMNKRTGKRVIRSLVLTPTRELAMQIYESFEAYGRNLSLRACVVFGGVAQQPQVAKLKSGVDILVATPGRLNDLIGQGYISLDNIGIFVLDEADRMLDMGFIHDVRKVIALLPTKRQTLFFSATMPNEVEKLAMGILTKPVNVKVDPVTSTVDAIEQSVYLIDKVNKKLLLAHLLNKPEVESALVFTRTKHGADRVVRELQRAGIASVAIHGDKSQNARQDALKRFKDGDTAVLIATDIAARGIDIAGLSHVINYDLPNEPESYIHRIGRTGRAGLNGTAISFCCIDEMKELYAIEKLTGKHLPRAESEWPMQVFTETVKEPRPPRPSKRGEAPVVRVTDVDRFGNAKKQVRGDGGRQGAQAGRGGAQSARGSEKSPRASAQAPRGTEKSGRGGAQSARGSEKSPRASAQAPRGVEKSGRGGAQSARGSEKSPRTSAQAPRGAEKSGRASAQTARGTEKPSRASAQASRTSSKADQTAPAMRATPLERPAHGFATTRSSSGEAFDTPRSERATHSERMERSGYGRNTEGAQTPNREQGQASAKPRRQAPRRPLSTGQDRR